MVSMALGGQSVEEDDVSTKLQTEMETIERGGSMAWGGLRRAVGGAGGGPDGHAERDIKAEEEDARECWVREFQGCLPGSLNLNGARECQGRNVQDHTEPGFTPGNLRVFDTRKNPPFTSPKGKVVSSSTARRRQLVNSIGRSLACNRCFEKLRPRKQLRCKNPALWTGCSHRSRGS